MPAGDANMMLCRTMTPAATPNVCPMHESLAFCSCLLYAYKLVRLSLLTRYVSISHGSAGLRPVPIGKPLQNDVLSFAIHSSQHVARRHRCPLLLLWGVGCNRICIGLSCTFTKLSLVIVADRDFRRISPNLGADFQLNFTS